MNDTSWQQALFTQSAPELGNQYRDDPLLAGWLRRTLPADVLRDLEPELDELGGVAGGELYRFQLEDRLNEPRHTPWDAWGNRIDLVEVTPLWKQAERSSPRSRGWWRPRTNAVTGVIRACTSSRWCICSRRPPMSIPVRWQ
jgi:hypothetical protein